jgi:hypothetical protein
MIEVESFGLSGSRDRWHSHRGRDAALTAVRFGRACRVKLPDPVESANQQGLKARERRCVGGQGTSRQDAIVAERRVRRAKTR